MRRPIVAFIVCLLLTATGLGLLGVAASVTQATAGPTAAATPEADALPETEPISADVLMLSPDGPVVLRVTHLALPPGVVLTPSLAPVPTALVVEVGTVEVLTYAAIPVGLGVQEVESNTELRRGEHLVVDPGTVRAVRNAGPAPAVVLVVAIEPFAAASTSP
jgi:hypothetical protein